METREIPFRHKTLVAVETVAEKSYSITDSGGVLLYHMAREAGFTPNGNAIDGRWVLRKPDGSFIMVAVYRHDIFDRIGHVLVD